MPQEFFDEEHIPESVNFCVYEMVFLDEIMKAYPDKNTSIIVYGNSNKTFESLTGAQKLVESGYKSVHNFSGGIKKGYGYLGHVNLNMGISFKQNEIWSGQFFVELQHTHGSTPSTDLVGDIQVFSNIENGNYTYLFHHILLFLFPVLTIVLLLKVHGHFYSLYLPSLYF